MKNSFILQEEILFEKIILETEKNFLFAAKRYILSIKLKL